MNPPTRVRCVFPVRLLAPAVSLCVGWLCVGSPCVDWRCAAAAEPEVVGVVAMVEEGAVAKELALTEEQSHRLRELIDRREAKAIDLAYLPREERAEKLAAFRRESEAKGLALLSPQQRARLEQIRVRRLGLSSLVEPAIAEGLDLDQRQQGQIAEILRRRDERLSRADEDTRRVVRAETERKLSLVLNDQQRATWEAISGGSSRSDSSARPISLPVPARDVADSPGQAAEPPPEAPAVGMADGPTERSAAAESRPAGTPGKIFFNFRYQPWKDVLEWFADKADLSYVADFAPEGTFNYTDTREYTPAEAIDLLNSVLLFKNYTLVRHDRMLMLINLDDGIPPNLISTIPLEELDDRGEYELVSVLFELQKTSPEEVEIEIQKLIGPQGSVVTLSKARQILVTETAGRLRAIRTVIRRIEDPTGVETGQMRALPLEYAFPDEVMLVIRSMLQIPEGQNVAPDGSLRFAADPAGNRLLVSGKPEMLSRVEEILKLVDVPGPGQLDSGHFQEQLQLEVYSVTSADPEAVLGVMQTLMAGLPDVRLTTDAKTGNLVALARPSQHKTIKATLEQMQRDARLIDVIYLKRVDPQLAVLSINKLFGAGKEGSKVNAPQVDADPTSRQLLVRATQAQLDQIRSLLEKMGETDTTNHQGPGSGNVRMLPLTGEAAETALEQVQQLWPTMRENRIRVVTPSALSPSMRQDGSGEAALRELRIPAPRVLSPRIPAATTPTRDEERAGREGRPWGDPRMWGPGMRGFRGGDRGMRGPEDRGPRDRGPGDRGASSPTPQTLQPGSVPVQVQPAEDKTTRHAARIPVLLVSQTAEPEPEVDKVEVDQPEVEKPPTTEPPSAEPQPAEPPAMEPLPAEPQPVEPPATGPLPAEPQPIEPQPVEPPAVEPLPVEPLPVEPPAMEPLPVEPQPAEPQPVEPGPAEVLPNELELPRALEVPSPESPDPTAAEAGQPAPIVITRVPGGLMIACEDLEALDEFESLLTTVAGSMTAGGPELTVFYLKHAKADAVSETLDQILGGGTVAREGGGSGGLIGDLAGAALGDAGGGILGSLLGLGGGGGTISPSGAIRITPDMRLNALIVQANSADLNMVQELLEVLDQKGNPSDILVVPKAKIIPVLNTQADEIATLLKQVYQNRMVTSSQAGGQPRPEDLIRALRGGRGRSGSQRGGEEELQKMSVGVDTRTNSLIVAAAEPLLGEVEALIQQLDERATESDQATRVVTLHRASGEAVQRALSALVGDSVQVGSSGGSSRRSDSRGGRSSNDASDRRQEFFRDMMRRRAEMMMGGGRPGGGPQPGGIQRGGGNRGR